MAWRTWPSLIMSCGGSGGIDEEIGMGLDQDAGFALVGFAKVIAGGDCFVDERFEIR